jgi:hypothetical protein
MKECDGLADSLTRICRVRILQSWSPDFIELTRGPQRQAWMKMPRPPVRVWIPTLFPDLFTSEGSAHFRRALELSGTLRPALRFWE